MRKFAVLVATLALALGLAAPSLGVSLSTSVSTPPAGVRASIDLTNAVDHTTVAPAEWPVPEMATGIGPGSHLIIRSPEGTAGCTANFIWAGKRSRLYLGAAGHCFLPEDKKAAHGPGADATVSGVRTFVCVADCAFGGRTGFQVTGELRQLGRVVYARQASPAGVDLGNDFGLVEIPRALHSLVRTAMPVFGGPRAARAHPSTGDLLCHYGAGLAVGETFATMGRTGIARTTTRNWFTANLAAVFGDSGSAVNTCQLGAAGVEGDRALGVITHIMMDGTLGGTTVARAIAMAREDIGLDITLVST